MMETQQKLSAEASELIDRHCRAVSEAVLRSGRTHEEAEQIAEDVRAQILDMAAAEANDALPSAAVVRSVLTKMDPPLRYGEPVRSKPTNSELPISLMHAKQINSDQPITTSVTAGTRFGRTLGMLLRAIGLVSFVASVAGNESSLKFFAPGWAIYLLGWLVVIITEWLNEREPIARKCARLSFQAFSGFVVLMALFIYGMSSSFAHVNDSAYAGGVQSLSGGISRSVSFLSISVLLLAGGIVLAISARRNRS
jgi:hypothetical protein